MGEVNKALYTGKEPVAHQKARMRVQDILVANFMWYGEPSTIKLNTDFGPRDYTPDILGFDIENNTNFIVEIDGESHADRKYRDKVRDAAFAAIGVRTIRFTVEEIIGFKLPKGKERLGKLNNDEILNRITLSISRSID